MTSSRTERIVVPSDLVLTFLYLLCGINFALILHTPSFAPFHHRVTLTAGVGRRRGRGAISSMHQAEREEGMKQVIVCTNDNEEVWVETPTGHIVAGCFFKAPDETPEELEHMGYPQLLHLYPPEAILVGPGIAPEEVEEIFVEA